jgi:predicted permease
VTLVVEGDAAFQRGVLIERVELDQGGCGGIVQGVMLALRAAARMPGLSAVVILSLGVGIGINTTVFSWIQAVVLRPLPGVADGGAFHLVEPRSETGSYPGVSWLEYHDLRDRLPAFRDLVAFRMAPTSAGEPGQAERTYALLVSGNYFEALGLRPAAGRFVQPPDAGLPGGEPILVISHDYWNTRFARDPAAVGREIRVNGSPLTIVGVAPEGFQGTVIGLQFDFWIPATMAPALMVGSRELEDRGLRGYSVIGRLRDGAPVSRAQAEATSAFADFARTHPEASGAMTGEVMPLWRAPRGPQRLLASGLGILQALMLVVLLAVCGNLATLMLARASTRQREVGVRLALGASPGAVARLILAETLLLSLAGTLAGLLLAWWGTGALRAMPAYGAVPVRFQTSVDGMGLAVAALLGVGAAMLVGLLPAWRLARVDPQQALRAGARAGGRSLARDTLMAVQVGLALLVLLAAGLFFRNFADTRVVDPGFRPEGLLLASYDLTGRVTGGVEGAREVREFADGVLARLRPVAGVEGVSIASAVPLDLHGLPLRAFALEGRLSDPRTPDRALTMTVTPGYFAVMGVPLVAGRDFADLSDAAAPPQVMVNETFVRRFVEGEPLGRRVTSRGREYLVAGVVRDSTYEAFGEPSKPALFFSYRDVPAPLGEIHLRARAGAETTFASEIRRAVQALDPSLPLYNVRTMETHIETNLFLRTIPARLFIVVAPLLLALVSIGIYAVVAYSVARRTAEIGVRMAVGATPRGVVWHIVREALIPIGIGALAGWVLAIGIDRHLFRVGFDNWPVLIGVPVVLLGVALLSSWLPARRATRVDPLVALRQE